jgi:two-component system CheB/CheR fusion protein
MPALLDSLLPGQELKLWVAACATGEEAYSLAIILAEQLADRSNGTVVKIFATDIDSEALVFAAKGIYNERIKGEVSATRLDNYFTKEGLTYKVKPEIRNMVIFAQHDLVKNPPYCNMHFISCRNLLIYMTPVLQTKVLAQFLFGLKQDGYLFLGPSEKPVSVQDKFQLVNKKWKIYKNLEGKKTTSFDPFLMPTLGVKPIPEKFSQQDIQLVSEASLVEAVNTALVGETGSLVLCIDENNLVVKTYGDTTKYLLQKNFTPNLTELLPGPLVIAFNNASHSAIKTNKKASIHGIQVKHNESIINVCLSVTPLDIKKRSKRFLVVSLSEENMAVKVEAAPGLQFNGELQIDEYTRNIENELKELKEELKTAYFQLDATGTDMQSYNEEMISANEEMQSTNEEMQSVNEELHTINLEYQLKNKELEELNSDLDNYFRSNINGQLFVNRDLILMKFAPGTVKQINLLPTDIGRPLSNISTNIKFETLIADVKLVLERGNIITKEIETNNGLWYQVMTMPYLKQQNNKISGAIITINDITELKKSQAEVERRNRTLERINNDLDNFVLTASHDLLAPLSNIEMSIDVMNKLSAIGPELNQYLMVINNSVKKFRSLITDIATVAKVENSMMTMEMVDVDEVLDNIMWSLDEKIKSSGAVINRRLNVKRILFSKKNLRSLLFNLVANGIKYNKGENPEIIVSTSWEDNHVVLSVEDFGIGISEEEKEKVFAMYGRGKTEIEGQGIGLYLVQKIVDAGEGHLVVESKEGQGSKFIIHFKSA